MDYANPKYVLKFNEHTWGPTKNAKQIRFAKIAVRIIVMLILVGSLIFGDNLFEELSFGPQMLLIAMCLGTFFVNDKEKVAKPMEIRFYDDYMVLYREKRYYSPKCSRKEYTKFFYKDIKKIVYRPVTKRLNICGLMEGIWYNYQKDGSLPEKPSYHKTTDSLAYFYTNVEPDIDFIALFEKYTSIKVTIEEI